MTRNRDASQQTSQDMAKARAGTSIYLEAVRDYLYGVFHNPIPHDWHIVLSLIIQVDAVGYPQ